MCLEKKGFLNAHTNKNDFTASLEVKRMKMKLQNVVINNCLFHFLIYIHIYIYYDIRAHTIILGRNCTASTHCTKTVCGQSAK